MKPASLLIELHTEELPSKSLKALSSAFAAGIESGLRARHFLTEESQTTALATPRRLAVHITHVKSRSADQPVRWKLMPLTVAQDAAKNWTTAFIKKLESLGRVHLSKLALGTADGPDTLVVENDGKADAVFLNSVAAGHALDAGVQEALNEALAKLPIAKAMNYQLADGTTTVQFVRPAHRLVALHGHELLPVSALGLLAGTKTFGHRFHAPGELVIHSADTYEEQLRREGRVIASFEKRRATIVEALRHAAHALEAVPVMPDALLDEVTALVEWPVVYESGFEAEFLEVPQECLVLTMQQNQKYFALRDANGQLRNRFLLVSNIEATDPAAIVTGNARVVRARLADAKFFYDQDRKTSLESRVAGLASVVYHHKLGSQLERMQRVTRLAKAISPAFTLDIIHVERAARLAKTDLRTLMVGEFPELQGLMGRYYARYDGEANVVAHAVEQHYWPRFAGDALPTSGVATSVALADKLETLVGLYSIGERPTGDKDPYALRRHALGVLRILLAHERAPQLRELITQAGATPAIADELETFFFERLRGLLRDEGYTANEVEAVLALRPQHLARVPQQLAAVRAFMALPESESLAAANKRISNILKKTTAVPAAFDEALLVEPAEKTLAQATTRLIQETAPLYTSGDYTALLRALAPLKAPVDQFFDAVMVNAEDARLRDNRLALLAQLHTLMNRVADISLLAAG